LVIDCPTYAITGLVKILYSWLFLGSGRNWSHIATHLFVLVVIGATVFKKRNWLRRFKSDRGEICQDCSSINMRYRTSNDAVGFFIWRHPVKMAAMTSFHTERCCHLVSAQAASAGRICSSVRPFLIRSTFVFVTHVAAAKSWNFVL